MTTPGRPHEPTIHPRTRPEATDNAMKMRGTGDWFRHDGKNIEEPTPPAIRLATKDAGDIAVKNKGEPDKWFDHDEQHPAEPDEAPKPRLPSAEAKEIHDRQGSEEGKWYKMEENKDYHTPRVTDHVSDQRGLEIKQQSTHNGSSQWYRHEHDSVREATPPKHRVPTENAGENERKLQGVGKPEWYSHDQSPTPADEAVGSSRSRNRPVSRLTNKEAGNYLERNKHGSVAEWYSHEDRGPCESVVSTPRVTSSEAVSIAGKLKGESENWYDYDQKASPKVPKEKYVSAQAKEMLDKSRGNQMKQVMDVAPGADQTSEPAPRIKPEASEVAKKNQQGLMDKYLKQEGNKGYESTRPAPRIKPEAEENQKKNQGVTGECMGGYLPDPEKHSQKRIKPEAAENADKHSGGTMSRMMQGELPTSPRKAGRGITTQGEFYAERNKGSLKSMMDNYGKLEIDSKPIPKLQTSEASAIAAKHKGSVAACFSYDGY